MTKQYSWVPVLEDDDSKIYVPRQYETKDIYQGKDCLPMYDNKEDCEQWFFNHSQNFYVSRWLNDILNEITKLENQSFEGWSDETVSGYLTACKTIKEKYGTRKRYI